MKRKRIIALIAFLVLMALMPLGIQAWAVAVLRGEARQRISVTWESPNEHLRVAASRVRLDLPRWRPLTMEILQRPVDTDRLVLALHWVPRTLQSIRIKPQHTLDALRLYGVSMRFHDLEYLEMEGAEVDDAAFAKLARLSRLKGISLDALPGQVPNEIACSTTLEVLSVKKLPGTTTFTKMYAFPNLRRLHVGETNMTLAEVMAFNWTHPSLESLSVGCRAGASRQELIAWAALIKRQIPRLQQLQVSSGQVFVSR
jgi:hypothetical protein